MVMLKKSFKVKRIFFLNLFILTLLSSCSSASDEDIDNETTQESEKPIIIPANLLFSSGFEGVELSQPIYDYQYITGTDTKTGYSWPPSIFGFENAAEPSGIHNVNDDNGAAIDNELQSIIGPNGESSTVLFQRVNYDVQVTQAPYQINGITENPKELYIKYWMKTDDFSVQGNDTWRAIWTYKTEKYATNQDGFRMIAFMATDIKGNPYWMLQGDINPETPIWQVVNDKIPLIMGEWFKVEYHVKWSNGTDGYASMKVNDQLIGEHFGRTTANNDDLDFIMLTQVYGSNYPMYQWVDDVEIWDGVPTN